VKETLELLKRPDLDDDEKIIKAHAIYLEGDIPQAYNQFSQLYEKYPENELVIIGYANSLIDIGDLKTAGELLESYKNRTKNPYLFDSLSRYYFYKGEIDKSLESLKIAINYSKNDPIAYNLALIHYAIIMASIGRFKEAYESFNNVIVNLKNFDNAYYLSFAYTNVMNFYIKQRDKKKLEILKTEIEESLNLSGSSRTKFLFYLNYAFIIAETDKEKAISYIKNSIDIAVEKGSPQMLSLGLNGLGDIYAYLKEFEKSEIYLNEALKITKENELIYNMILTLTSLIQLKIVLNRIDEAIKLFEILPSDEQIPPPDLIILNSLKALIYYKGDNEKFKTYLKITKNLINEFKIFDIVKIFPALQNEISKLISSEMTIDEIIEIGRDFLLSEKIKNEPKVIKEFLEKLNVEDSLNYIEIIKNIAKEEQKFKIQIDRFSEHWRKFCEQYITTFGDIVYFFNNDIKPITIFGDDINLLILLYLISNRNRVITYGNLSIAFGIHSENIKPRLKQILEVIEPWTITQTPKYLIIENDRILFKTDENFKVDLYLFEDYLKNGDLESAINIYHGDFMPYITHPYFSELRNKLKNMYLDAVYNLAKKFISENQYDRAVVILEGLLNRDILNVEHLKLLIWTLYKLGKRAYAYEWYLRYLSKIEEPKFKFEEAIL
jgi:tetratricopeptide (TPR) repeat protein